MNQLLFIEISGWANSSQCYCGAISQWCVPTRIDRGILENSNVFNSYLKKIEIYVIV